MKRHFISKFYFNLFVLCACFLFGFVIFWCWVVAQSPDESSIFVDIAPIAFTLPGALSTIYALCFTFSGGKITVDRSGCIMYVGWKKYCYAGDDLPCCGMADVDVGSVGNAVDTYWVYLSSRNLSVNERRRFIQNTNRYVKTMVFFQYDPELFDLVLQYAPEPLRSSSSFPARRNGSARRSLCASADFTTRGAGAITIWKEDRAWSSRSFLPRFGNR